ncbi:hypothetical protein T265_02715 [Opisthorchis viverrini]|uniref:Uncharacterized protein n=1 Tax=Opisthorchis viverrini TaxID=6198 RepID=A0A075AI26_OPIVI|nr:hypothetical protein T265_02715 [Opisthorchis viverrini]KER30899.1 hypothetical protein T265_02715 [Opisthorchis viverrini]
MRKCWKRPQAVSLDSFDRSSEAHYQRNYQELKWLPDTQQTGKSEPMGSGLDTFFSACRERCRFPQLEVHLPGDKAQPGSVLNDLIASLLNNFKRLSQQSRGGAATVHGEVRIFKTLNAISSAIGSILFGNLQLIRKDLLIELTWALLTEANSRMDHQNSNDSHQLYVTLSHLAYLRSVWDKRETSSHSTDKQDFLSEPKLFHALLEVFVAGLRHFESLDSAHSARMHSAVAPFRCLAAMPPEGCTRAGILPGYPSLDRGSREAEVGFEPRTFRSVSPRSNHLGRPARVCLEREFTDWLIRSSNPTSTSQLLLSRLVNLAVFQSSYLLRAVCSNALVSGAVEYPETV